jgi:ATP/maltotriose-dependent transcriptional regulator MalT
VPLESTQAIRAAALAGLARWLAGNQSFDPVLRSFTSRLATASSSSDSPLMLMALTAADATDAPHRVLRQLAEAAGHNGADGPSTAEPTPNADTRAWELARLADTALMVDAIEPARTLARRASEQLRTSGSFGALTTVLSTWCHAEFSAGDWDATARLGREVLDLAAVTGQQRQAAFVKANLAFLAAAQDRPGEAQRLRGEVLTWATPRQHRLIAALASWSQLLGALGDGEVDLALEAARLMQPPSAFGTPPPAGSLMVASACADVVEALGRADRHDDASAVVDWVEERLRRWPSPTLAGHAAHARAVLAELSGAGRTDVEVGYERAIAAAVPTGSFAHARVRLAYGAWLRRTRQARRSRAHLTIAEELFAGLGAAAWQRRADAELRAAGQVALEREADPTEIDVEDGREQLTAQEKLIVELAAEGLSNRQIGERLYLSPRTVGSHLYKAFPKLGVSNRTQLRTALQGRQSSDRIG